MPTRWPALCWESFARRPPSCALESSRLGALHYRGDVAHLFDSLFAQHLAPSFIDVGFRARKVLLGYDPGSIHLAFKDMFN